ncbi:MAG: bifunctional adenosylcobinamide kinase/adenosylcobinamide-phosphate guanylyltransferase [Cyanobacteria bacterium P01_D01_bin.105]
MSTLLITGPSRSGKSEWAEQLAAKFGGQHQQIVYIATAQADLNDAEWQARIEQHQKRRPSHWTSLEVPVDLAKAIAKHDQRHCLLIDSLGTWLANSIEQSTQEWMKTQAQLLSALQHTEATVILVAEETGWGVVPAYETGRRFRDRLGILSRQVGAIATETYLVTSGYALPLSKLAEPVQGHLRT